MKTRRRDNELGTLLHRATSRHTTHFRNCLQIGLLVKRSFNGSEQLQVWDFILIWDLQKKSSGERKRKRDVNRKVTHLHPLITADNNEQSFISHVRYTCNNFTDSRAGDVWSYNPWSRALDHMSLGTFTAEFFSNIKKPLGKGFYF